MFSLETKEKPMVVTFCRFCSSLIANHISYSAYCGYQLDAEHFVDFAPQETDVNVHSVGFASKIETPDIFQQSFAGDNDPFVFQEILQHIKFALCEFDGSVPIPHLAAVGIQTQKPRTEHWALGASGLLAQRGPNARQQFFNGKWLSDVVICA